jgi:methyltransferase family protein
MGKELNGNDPGRWGHSLANDAELLLACLDAVRPRSIVEVGAYAGDTTRVLLDWSQGTDTRLVAIDPTPQDELVALAAANERLELVRETSVEALPHVAPPEAVIIDGDHNWWSVSEELRLIAERAAGTGLPLLVFHDVAWPHARRDSYYAPERVPPEHRQPIVEAAGVVPDEPGVKVGGLPYHYAAAREGGPRNGVLTAVEDFVAQHDGLRLAIVPAFFGFGVAWREDAPWAGELAAALALWDGNPLLERLEANRVHHLAASHVHLTEANMLRERLARQEALLRRLLDSSAFGVAERLSRLRVRAGVAAEHSAVSKEDIRRVLSD